MRVARALPPKARKFELVNWPHWPVLMEVAVDRIVQANIVRFTGLLETETDPVKRSMIIRLLSEERAKELPEVAARDPGRSTANS
jgi:hypothetical protein